MFDILKKTQKLCNNHFANRRVEIYQNKNGTEYLKAGERYRYTSKETIKVYDVCL